MKPKAVIKV